MTPFEVAHLCLQPFYPPLYRMVRKRLRALAGAYPDGPDVLDVGGRKSPYTIGVPALITITDLPRTTALQEQRGLGLSDEMVRWLRTHRSNVRAIGFDDMTRSALPDRTFDVVVAVEVLEHVAEDARFVAEVRRVLKPEGVFMMTTPNGDFVHNTNPDHRRHYRLQHLRALLAGSFETVEIEYAIRGGPFRTYGLRPWSLRRPRVTLFSMAGNAVNGLQSARARVKGQARGTHHLIALARGAPTPA